MSFFDHYGLLHVEPNVPSENGIYFLAHYLRKHSNRKTDLPLVMTVYRRDGSYWYQANPPEQGEHFSHDNMLGLYYCHLAIKGEVPNYMPICYWNSRIWWHPRDWIVFAITKGKLPVSFARLLFPLIWFSFLKAPEHTSGKLLWLLRADMFSRFFNYHKMYAYVLKKIRKQYKGEEGIYKIYFRNPAHPMNQYFRDIQVYME